MSPDVNRQEPDPNVKEKTPSEFERTLHSTDFTQQNFSADVTSMESETPRLPIRRPRFDELKQIANYQIIRELGVGGMGKVFEAEDSLLHRRVAIKVMKPDLPDEREAKERFIREARAAAAVTHDHIVTIYQVGEDLGYPFLAMQLLQGENLDQRLKKMTQLPIPEILRIGSEIARGLSAAHEKGLVHRDIKPANIWLESPRDRVKILDFGLARPTEASTQLTNTGMVMGTPAYMSPEQSRGEPLDSRCDLFSLGCILYQMCTGIRPFDGPTFVTIIRNLELHQPTEVKALNPSVPTALNNLIMRLLAKHPNDRPHSAHEVVETLETIHPAEVRTFFESTTPTTPTPSFLSNIRTPTPEPKVRAKPVLPTIKNPTPIVPLQRVTLPELSRPVSSFQYPTVNQEQSVPWSPTPKSRSSGCFLIAFLLLCLGGGGGYYYFEIYDRGTLVIQTDDPNAVIDIIQDGVVKHQSITRREFSLRPGGYQVVLDKPKGAELDHSKVTIERGKSVTIKVLRPR
jgi:serine/threonine protein kinase